MSRRIDIELTSRAPDGNFTWRAAGARQPKGVVDASLVPGGVDVGGVVRAEIEVGIEGIEVISVLPPKAPRTDDAEAQRIEVVGTVKSR